MAVFSDLPNELIMHIWSYVIEPESVESFALVSKRVYGLATLFLREHARLKQKYSAIYCPDFRMYNGAAILLERMLLNPRIALYINDFRIEEWASCWEERYDSSLNSYPKVTLDLFREAIRSSPLVAPSEAGEWVKIIKKGDEDPILALIIMQIRKLTRFELKKSFYKSDHFIVETLGRIAQSLEAAIHPGPSIAGSEINSPSRFSNLSDLKLKFSKITLGQLSRLLRGTRKLRFFSFIGGTGCSIESFQICNELLASSQHSLAKLNLRTNLHGIAEGETSYMGEITRFEKLAALETDFSLMLGHKDEACSVLADVLPISIERVTLYSTEIITSKTLSEVVLHMVESEMDSLPNLRALKFDLINGPRLVNSKLFTELEQKSRDVGVLLSFA